MIVNIQCLTKACDLLAIPYRFLDKNRNFVAVGNTPVYFSNCSTPWNSEEVAHICKDKEFAYDLLSDVVTMPKTRGYFDPFRRDYKEYIQFDSIDVIAKDIVNSFALPCVIKRNAGSRAKNVFVCSTETEIEAALRTVFDQQSKEYDFVALAQAYIQPARELRVVTLNKKVVFVYDWSNEYTIIGKDSELFKKIEQFVAPIFTNLDLNWSGLDIIVDEHGKLHLIELNSKPCFEKFVENKGDKEIVEIYKKMLASLSL